MINSGRTNVPFDLFSNQREQADRSGDRREWDTIGRRLTSLRQWESNTNYHKAYYANHWQYYKLDRIRSREWPYGGRYAINGETAMLITSPYVTS